MAQTELGVLFVCLGNICRSPLAEALFVQKVKEKGYESRIRVDSCGTGDWHIGDDPDPRTLDVCQRNGLPIDHKARQFVPEDFDQYDYVIAMDQSNIENIIQMAGARLDEDRLLLMREFDNERSSKDVPDPYFGGKDGFDRVYSILDAATNNFLNYLEGRHFNA